MNKFSYKEVAKQQGWCFDSITPIEEQENTYYFYREVANVIEPSTVMLDVGCGSGEKSIPYYSYAKKVIMIDNEPEMLKRVNSNFHQNYLLILKLK